MWTYGLPKWDRAFSTVWGVEEAGYIPDGCLGAMCGTGLDLLIAGKFHDHPSLSIPHIFAGIYKLWDPACDRSFLKINETYTNNA